VIRRTRTPIARATVAAGVLAAAATAIAVPSQDPRRSPEPVLARTSAPLAHSNSRDGQAVLTASNLKPGERRSGEVTITNEGHPGALYLVAHEPHDTPAASGLRLSERLQLTIADTSGASSRTIADAPLSTVERCHPLGELAAGESRTYRFSVEFPDGGPKGADNGYAGASATVDYEWLETAAARDACPGRSEDSVELADPALPPTQTSPQVTATLAEMKLAIMPGPYRLSARTGTAKVGIRCIRSLTGTCKGRLELERRKHGQGRGIAMAVGNFDVQAGRRERITLKLNRRAYRRITTKGLIAVRAYVIARDAHGRRHRVAYRDRLLFHPAKRPRSSGRGRGH
jgi:hypothetical protein